MLWFRLTTIGVAALVFSEALILGHGKAQGWSFYLTPLEVSFEITVRLVAAALIGTVLGSICVAVALAILWTIGSSRARAAEWITKAAVFAVVFLVCRYALDVLINWSYDLYSHRAIFDKLLWVAFYAVFAAALFLPRGRKQVVTSMDGLLSNKMTRRTALATVTGAAALVTTEFILSRSVPAVRAPIAPTRSKSNILLITFDALSAKDMSLYGYELPTTPNIDAFARKSTIFRNFYATCTFTTPCVASMLTGTYLSEHHVYQLQGRLRPADSRNSLPRLMKNAGFRTGAFISNPFPYYLAYESERDFDVLTEPVFESGGVQYLWAATTPMHQNSGIGSRADEYRDLAYLWNGIWDLPATLIAQYRPAATFQHANEILASAPDGFFLWIHVLTPHDPYLPDPADRGRFVPDDNDRTYDEQGRWQPTYPPEVQELVSKLRLRYDEFMATGDRAFGEFIAEFDKSRRSQNTTIIVSADHGESFEGGVFKHETAHLTRPVIQVPLIVRTPNQETGVTVDVTADQTSLAPTILELAKVAKPRSMKGPSLVPWLSRDGAGAGEGVAFSQFFERNSVYKPIRRGTVGVIDDKFQYIVYIDKQKGELRPLAEAQFWNLDRSAEYPEQAKSLRKVLHERFPELVKATT